VEGRGLIKRWAGVDVGGRRKNFDAAVIDADRVVAGPSRLSTPQEVVEWLRPLEPRVVAVDSPRTAAPATALSREGERDLVRAGVCGIRFTPNERALQASPAYYEWIQNGFELYRALERAARRAGWEVIECFPTASWSRWAGPRGQRRRAAWTRNALATLNLNGLPARTNQDARDAIAAARTAQAYSERGVEMFGDIVVPVSA
jgi:predicted nuclease with RNAse H fold